MSSRCCWRMLLKSAKANKIVGGFNVFLPFQALMLHSPIHPLLLAQDGDVPLGPRIL